MIPQQPILQENLIPQIKNIAAPQGWYPGEEIQSYNDVPAVIQTFERTVNATLPLAAKRAEDLITMLDQRYGINVSTAYLTIDVDATYHVLLLVSQEEYHSPYMQAAHILVEKFAGSSVDLPIRFTFTVGREHMISHFNSGQYKFKYVHSIEMQKPVVSKAREAIMA